jgi:RimJ/RimL family protein N-acetyltransferase
MSSVFAIPYTLAHAARWIAQNLTPPFHHFCITFISDPDTVLGDIGINPGNDVEAHTGELGYWLGEAYWGQGIMQEVLRGMVAYGFRERGYRKLTAKVVAGNMGSERCLQKCGFVQEGRLRGQILKHGELSDLTLWGLLKEEWEEGTSQGKE